MEINGYPIEDSGTIFKYTSTLLFTFNIDEEKIVGWRFDDNGFKGVTHINVEMIGQNKFIIKGESLLYTLQETWELIYPDKINRKSKNKNKRIVKQINQK